MGDHVELGADSVLLKLHTDDGIIGIGNTGATSTWYQGELQESITAMINTGFSGILLGENPFNIEKIVAKMDNVAKNNDQAKCLVDFALHDLVGKALKIPVYNLLGGKSMEKIPLAFVMPSGTPDQIVAISEKALRAGFKTIKIKAGHGRGEDALANLRAVRETFGYDVEVFVDANGGFNYYDALLFLKQAEKYDIHMCEQPVPRYDIDGMARLRQKVGTPIYADEAADELAHVLEIVKKDAADGFLIKITKAGGLLKAQKWVSIAKAAGLPVVCGCMMGSGFEAAAIAHFIIATEWMGRQVHEDLGPLHLHDCFETKDTNIANDLALNVPLYEDGFLYCPDGPGVGVSLNEEKLPELITKGKTSTVVELGH
jgi:L-alanine-DL-glutamate epimerase-like enolase superfamily enzyme